MFLRSYRGSTVKMKILVLIFFATTAFAQPHPAKAATCNNNLIAKDSVRPSETLCEVCVHGVCKTMPLPDAAHWLRDNPDAYFNGVSPAAREQIMAPMLANLSTQSAECFACAVNYGKAGAACGVAWVQAAMLAKRSLSFTEELHYGQCQQAANVAYSACKKAKVCDEATMPPVIMSKKAQEALDKQVRQ